jgi:putative ABC transport system permease protein
MILYERIREIGTMRAVGMRKKDAGRIFSWEAVLLSVLGAFVGFALAVVFMTILGFFTIKSPELSMFLRNGHWTYIITPLSLGLKFLLIIVLTLIAVSGSARSAARMNPADALRTVK